MRREPPKSSPSAWYDSGTSSIEGTSRASITALSRTLLDSMTPDDSSQLVLRLRDGTRVTASREISKQLRADSL